MATNVAGDRLKSFIQRIERLEEEKDTMVTDIKEVYSEAKGEGYDTKILRKVVRKLKQDRMERQEEDALMELYMNALGES